MLQAIDIVFISDVSYIEEKLLDIGVKPLFIYAITMNSIRQWWSSWAVQAQYISRRQIGAF